MKKEDFLRWLDFNDLVADGPGEKDDDFGITPFNFEQLDRNRLLELCGNSEKIIGPLEFEVLNYKLASLPVDPEVLARVGEHPDSVLPQGDEPPAKKRLLREVNALGAASRKLVDEIGTAHPYVRRGIVSQALWREHIDEERFVAALELIEDEVRWWLKYKGDVAMVKGRGRPVDYAIHVLNCRVARMLHKHGLALTKGRDGVLAQVLAIVREAVGRPLAIECLDEIIEAVDSVLATDPFDEFDPP